MVRIRETVDSGEVGEARPGECPDAEGAEYVASRGPRRTSFWWSKLPGRPSALAALGQPPPLRGGGELRASYDLGDCCAEHLDRMQGGFVGDGSGGVEHEAVDTEDFFPAEDLRCNGFRVAQNE